MAQQQQNITISAPGFQGMNTEDSPLTQDPGFCFVADNAVVDKYGRIGSRKAFGEFTTAINVTVAPNPASVRVEEKTHRLGVGTIGTTNYVLATVGVYQYDGGGVLVQADHFICKLTSTGIPVVHSLDELTYPTLTDPSALTDAVIKAFNDRLYIFSKGNSCLVFDGASITELFTGTLNVDYIPPQDDNGVTAPEINGDIAASAFGRLWVSGVNGDYQTIHYSSLLNAKQWYDGKATPTDSSNTGGLINVNEYWPAGTDRIVSIVAHNGVLFVLGRSSILVYGNAATGDPAGQDGIVLSDTITNIGCVNRDAVANIGSDVLFVDDSGVRSLGRTIQEKSAPLGDLTANIRRDISNVIASTQDKRNIALTYWPDENLTVVHFAHSGEAYAMEMRAPSVTGGSKITRWTGCVWERALFYEDEGEARTLLASSANGRGLLRYEDAVNFDGQPFEFKYESNAFSFGQSANLKFLKQIDYTTVATGADTLARAGWGYNGRLEYSKTLTVPAQTAALYGVSFFNQGEEYGPGLTTIKRVRLNAKGSGESVVIGLRVDINGNTCSLQEINVQTLSGRTL